MIPSIGICITEYYHKKDIVYAKTNRMTLALDVFSPKGELNYAGMII
ncbi:MAG: hypothetical protein IQL11_11580 [Bacteroidales bacterium]|nr:hypothetical protein [Bacteroidales bacterium]